MTNKAKVLRRPPASVAVAAAGVRTSIAAHCWTSLVAVCTCSIVMVSALQHSVQRSAALTAPHYGVARKPTSFYWSTGSVVRKLAACQQVHMFWGDGAWYVFYVWPHLKLKVLKIQAIFEGYRKSVTEVIIWCIHVNYIVFQQLYKILRYIWQLYVRFL